MNDNKRPPAGQRGGVPGFFANEQRSKQINKNQNPSNKRIGNSRIACENGVVTTLPPLANSAYAE